MVYVVTALVRRASYTPYRQFKPTLVAGHSLGANSFTAIILNITPNDGMQDEMFNTLASAKVKNNTVSPNTRPYGLERL